MIYRNIFLICVSSLLSVLIIIGIASCGQSTDTSSSSNTTTTSDTILPSIHYFNKNPSDQFLVSMNTVVDGHMYRGKNATDPHTGGHVYFSNESSTWPLNGVDTPSNYPPIFAVADGHVNKVDTYFAVADNYRYGINLSIATDEDNTISFFYSIEPFIDPEDSSFYEPYILVEVGDTVQKGDIIAYMYLAPNSGPNAHIHFNLLSSNNGPSTFLAPIIFTDSLVSDFAEHISTENGGYRNFDYNKDQGHPWMGDCLGYKIDASENPFSDTSEDCIK